MKTAWIVDLLNEDILTITYYPDNITVPINDCNVYINSTIVENGGVFRQLYSLVKVGCYIKFDPEGKLFPVTGFDDIAFPTDYVDTDKVFIRLSYSGVGFPDLSHVNPQSVYLAMDGWYKIKTATKHKSGEKEQSIILDNGVRVGEGVWCPEGGSDFEGAFRWIDETDGPYAGDMDPQPLYWRPLPRAFKDRYK